MSSTFFLVLFVLGQGEPDKAITDAEKKEFLKLLATLPTRGEFFTEEAVKKAVPYTRVLLALTEKDVGKHGVYPFLALSAGLSGHKEAREHVAANFDRIAHPILKLSWALDLFGGTDPPPEVLAFLRKALDSKQDARTLSGMLGPGFEDFKEDFTRKYEAGKLMKVESVKKHSIKAFPAYGGGHDYTNSTYIFAPGSLLYAVRPLKQGGELITYDLSKETTTRLVVPQPKDFKPRFDFRHYFGDPDLSVNSRGDLFCWWTIEGNGDHGFALLKTGAETFQVNRVAAYIGWSRVVAAPEGDWHLIQSESGYFVVHRVDKDLNLARIGDFRRHRSSGITDTRFISKSVLHLLCSEQRDIFRDRGGLRCIDFDVKEGKRLHNREMVKYESAWIRDGSALQLGDGSLHYLWGIEDRKDRGSKDAKREQSSGLYYRAEADSTTLKVGEGYDHRAIAVGDRILVCYSMESAPDKVFLRVIRHGTVGPEFEITVAKGWHHHLSSDYMAPYAEAGRIWFVNTLSPNTLYELRLVDETPKS